MGALGRGWGHPSFPGTQHPPASHLSLAREERWAEEGPERLLGRGGLWGGVFRLPLPPSALLLMPPHYLVCQWQTIKLKVSITSALSLRFASLLSIHHSLLSCSRLQPTCISY